MEKPDFQTAASSFKKNNNQAAKQLNTSALNAKQLKQLAAVEETLKIKIASDFINLVLWYINQLGESKVFDIARRSATKDSPERYFMRVMNLESSEKPLPTRVEKGETIITEDATKAQLDRTLAEFFG